MSELEALLVAVAAGAIGGGGLVWATRWAGPLVSRLLTGVVAVRRELDSDRDRIIDNLRDEVADYSRRLEDEERQGVKLAGQLEQANRRIQVLEAVIDELARRMGTSRHQLVTEVTRAVESKT